MAGESVSCSVCVENMGRYESDEIVQMYLQDVEASVTVPKWQLDGIQVIHLKPGEKADVTFEITPRQMSLIDNDGGRVLEPGIFKVFVGSSQPDERSCELTSQSPLGTEFELQGESQKLEY